MLMVEEWRGKLGSSNFPEIQWPGTLTGGGGGEADAQVSRGDGNIGEGSLDMVR